MLNDSTERARAHALRGSRRHGWAAAVCALICAAGLVGASAVYAASTLSFGPRTRLDTGGSSSRPSGQTHPQLVRGKSSTSLLFTDDRALKSHLMRRSFDSSDTRAQAPVRLDDALQGWRFSSDGADNFWAMSPVADGLAVRHSTDLVQWSSTQTFEQPFPQQVAADGRGGRTIVATAPGGDPYACPQVAYSGGAPYLTQPPPTGSRTGLFVVAMSGASVGKLFTLDSSQEFVAVSASVGGDGKGRVAAASKDGSISLYLENADGGWNQELPKVRPADDHRISRVTISANSQGKEMVGWVDKQRLYTAHRGILGDFTVSEMDGRTVDAMAPLLSVDLGDSLLISWVTDRSVQTAQGPADSLSNKHSFGTAASEMAVIRQEGGVKLAVQNSDGSGGMPNENIYVTDGDNQGAYTPLTIAHDDPAAEGRRGVVASLINDQREAVIWHDPAAGLFGESLISANARGRWSKPAPLSPLPYSEVMDLAPDGSVLLRVQDYSDPANQTLKALVRKPDGSFGPALTMAPNVWLDGLRSDPGFLVGLQDVTYRSDGGPVRTRLTLESFDGQRWRVIGHVQFTRPANHLVSDFVPDGSGGLWFVYLEGERNPNLFAIHVTPEGIDNKVKLSRDGEITTSALERGVVAAAGGSEAIWAAWVHDNDVVVSDGGSRSKLPDAARSYGLAIAASPVGDVIVTDTRDTWRRKAGADWQKIANDEDYEFLSRPAYARCFGPDVVLHNDVLFLRNTQLTMDGGGNAFRTSYSFSVLPFDSSSWQYPQADASLPSGLQTPPVFSSPDKSGVVLRAEEQIGETSQVVVSESQVGPMQTHIVASRRGSDVDLSLNLPRGLPLAHRPIGYQSNSGQGSLTTDREGHAVIKDADPGEITLSYPGEARFMSSQTVLASSQLATASPVPAIGAVATETAGAPEEGAPPKMPPSRGAAARLLAGALLVLVGSALALMRIVGGRR